MLKVFGNNGYLNKTIVCQYVHNKKCTSSFKTNISFNGIDIDSDEANKLKKADNNIIVENGGHLTLNQEGQKPNYRDVAAGGGAGVAGNQAFDKGKSLLNPADGQSVETAADLSGNSLSHEGDLEIVNGEQYSDLIDTDSDHVGDLLSGIDPDRLLEKLSDLGLSSDQVEELLSGGDLEHLSNASEGLKHTIQKALEHFIEQ